MKRQWVDLEFDSTTVFKVVRPKGLHATEKSVRASRSRLSDVIGANEEMFLSDRAFIFDLSIVRAHTSRTLLAVTFPFPSFCFFLATRKHCPFVLSLKHPNSNLLIITTPKQIKANLIGCTRDKTNFVTDVCAY